MSPLRTAKMSFSACSWSTATVRIVRATCSVSSPSSVVVVLAAMLVVPTPTTSTLGSRRPVYCGSFCSLPSGL